MKINALQKSGRLYQMQMRRIKRHLEAFEDRKDKGDWEPIWPESVKVKVGAFLAGLLLKVAKAPAVEDVHKDSP